MTHRQVWEAVEEVRLSIISRGWKAWETGSWSNRAKSTSNTLLVKAEKHMNMTRCYILYFFPPERGVNSRLLRSRCSATEEGHAHRRCLPITTTHLVLILLNVLYVTRAVFKILCFMLKASIKANTLRKIKAKPSCGWYNTIKAPTGKLSHLVQSKATFKTVCVLKFN